jgi:hypothetical protein
VAEIPPEGTLAERDLPELVQVLQESRWTGVLKLQRALVTKDITVEEGRLVFATSSDPDERLGTLLLRRGHVSLRQLIDAGKRVGAGKRLGTLLVEDGVLPPKELVRAVVDHSREVILSAFAWGEGRYRLEPGKRSPEAITLNIDPARLILEGIRRIESWRRIERAVGGLATGYRRRKEGGAAAERLGLDDEERRLADALARPHTVEELCAGSKLSSFEVCRLLWALRVIGFVEREPSPGLPLDDDGLGAVLAGTRVPG